MPRKPPKHPNTLADLGLHDPFEAVPVPEAGTRARTDSKGNVQLKRELDPKPGIYGFFARKLKYQHAIRLNLDETGSFFWNQIDSQTSLETIARRMREHFGFEDKACREAVIRYVKALMTRRLLCLAIPTRDHETNPTEAVDAN